MSPVVQGGQCPLAEEGQVWVVVSTWFEGDVGRCQLVVQDMHGSVSPPGLKWVTVPWMRWGALSLWNKADVGQCHLVVQGGRGSVSPYGSRWTWISVTSWFEVDQCHLLV